MFDKQKVVLVLFLVVVALAVFYVVKMEYWGVSYSPGLTKGEAVFGESLTQNPSLTSNSCPQGDFSCGCLYEQDLRRCEIAALECERYRWVVDNDNYQYSNCVERLCGGSVNVGSDCRELCKHAYGRLECVEWRSNQVGQDFYCCSALADVTRFNCENPGDETSYIPSECRIQ